jgi:excisionase family DNA binding protein
MTTRQTAAYLQMSYGYVRELIANGSIRSTKIGTAGRSSDRRVHRRWADAYLEGRATGGDVAAARATAPTA